MVTTGIEAARSSRPRVAPISPGERMPTTVDGMAGVDVFFLVRSEVQNCRNGRTDRPCLPCSVRGLEIGNLPIFVVWPVSIQEPAKELRKILPVLRYVVVDSYGCGICALVSASLCVAKPCSRVTRGT
jgi:hypothetical protein